MRKCICLYSGGLDSRLIIPLMKKLGVEVIAYHGLHCFEGKKDFAHIREKVERECLALGASKVVFRDMTAQILALLRSNRYGFGKNLNPCIDCRINTVTNGFEVMKEEGADFVCSGEVIGQRPKSQQRNGMNTVRNNIDELGYEGLFLRPLCAKLLEPTIPENEGWVDRESLYDFNGRTRNPQFELAEELGVTEFPNPAGGCLLTDVNFSLRMSDLLEHEKNIKNNQIDILKFGRHYRIPGGAKIVSARSSDDGDKIDQLAENGYMMLTAKHPGALVWIGGAEAQKSLDIAAGIAIHYSKFRGDSEVELKVWQVGEGSEDTAELRVFTPLAEAEFNRYRLG